MELIGRNKEIIELNTIMESGMPEFVVIYGRRRVGKTYLANQYFKDKFTFKFTGLAKKNKKEQLHTFWSELNRQGNKPIGTIWKTKSPLSDQRTIITETSNWL